MMIYIKHEVDMEEVMKGKKQSYGALELRIAKIIEKKNTATTIESNIQYNNKIMIKIIFF